MDNNILQIMNAIRDQESSGNYDAVNSDSGAFGAYQFMPDTWNDTASRYGLDASDTSPQNQDRMAYALMNEYYQQFGSPQAVAQAWYGGPGSVGSNVSGGAGYPDSDTYASEVMSKMGNGTFNFQAKSANNKPFLNMIAHLRTSDPNEKFNTNGILSIISQQNPNVKEIVNNQNTYGQHYDELAGALPSGVRKYVQPVADNLMQNQVNSMKQNIAQSILQNDLKKGQEAIGLINNSNNVDNKVAYSSIMKSFGIDVPSNADQYVGGKQLLGDEINQANSDRKYNLSQQQLKNNAILNEAQMGLLQDNLDHMNRLASLYGYK